VFFGRGGNVCINVISLWWFGHDVLVDMMEATNVDLIPILLTLTHNCSNSDISTMSGNENDGNNKKEEGSSDESDYNSEDSERAVRRKLEQMGRRAKKRKQEMVDLKERLEGRKHAERGKLVTKKKVMQLKDLEENNRLPRDKLISLNNLFRDVVFRHVKLVTKDVLESGVVVERIMKHLHFITDFDKIRYRAHIELALQKQIGQYRDNSVKNIKWKYRKRKGTGPRKSVSAGGEAGDCL
jgi:hypothetical protein